MAGKLNKQNDFLKSTLGYERLDAMAETLGGLSNEDFMGVMEKLNSLKFNKSDVYNGTDSTSTTLAASANALKTVKDLADSNASDIAELNSDLTVVDRFNVQAETTEGDVINWIKSFGSGKKAINLFQTERALMFGEAGNFYILLARNAIAEEITGIAVNNWNQHTFSFKYDSDFSYSRLISNADLPLSAKTYQLGGSQTLSFSYAGGNASCLIFAVRDSNAGIYLCDNWDNVVTAKDFANLNVSASNKTVTIQNNNASFAINVIVLIANNIPIARA